MTKPQLLKKLADETLSSIVSSKADWINYLKFSQNVYKYPFHKATLIYAQNPNATAVASMDLWNKKQKRWIKKGSKAIKVIDDNINPHHIEYLFDISDTVGNDKTKLIKWKYKEEYEKVITKNLYDIYGDNIADKNGFYNNIVYSISKMSQSMIYERQDEIKKSMQSSGLKKYDLKNVMQIYTNVVVSSSLYLVLKRLDFPIDEKTKKIINKNLDCLKYFDTPKSINNLGNITFDVSKEMLSIFEKAIKNEERKNFIEENNKNRERNRENGIELHRERWDTLSRDGRRPREQRTTGEIRNNGDELFEEELFESVQLSNNDRSDNGDLSGSGQGSREVIEKINNTTKTEVPITNKRGLYGNSEISEHDSEYGRGNDTKTSDISIQGRAVIKNSKQIKLNMLKNKEELYPEYESSFFMSENYKQEEKPEIKPSETKENMKYYKGLPLIIDPNRKESNIDLSLYNIGDVIGIDKDGLVYTLESTNKTTRTMLTLATEKQKEEFYKEYELEYRKQQNVKQEKNIAVNNIINESSTSTTQSIEDIEILNLEVSELEKLKTEIKDMKTEKTISVSNFKITNDEEIWNWNLKEKANQNIKVIKILKTIESQNRQATLEEQKELAKYVGWGGIPQIFNEKSEDWKEEYKVLKSLLTHSEYDSARRTTTDSFYTPNFVIENIYNALDRFGFEKGKILEPSMGIGKFFGILPDKMKNSKLYGVEIDLISGRISKQLYPNSNICIKGFEETEFEDNFFDVAISNVPFGQQSVYDVKFNKYNLSINNYFIAKTLDKVRQGGIIAFVTSKGTMDNKNPMVRKYIAERAELLGAIRLPKTTFEKNANTRVTTDILFFQKRENPIEIGIENSCSWLYMCKNQDWIELNEYYIKYPEMLLGKMNSFNNQYGKLETELLPDKSISLNEQLNKAINNLISNIYIGIQNENIDKLELEEEISVPQGLREFSYAIIDNKLYRRENSKMVEQQGIKEKDLERIAGMICIKNQLKQVIDVQMSQESDEILQKEQNKLNEIYDSYIKKYGFLTNSSNISAFKSDSDSNLLFSLENKDTNNNIQKANIFFKRTINIPKKIEYAETANEALTICLNEYGKVDLKFMENLTQKPVENIINDLRGIIFQNPIMYTGDIYSGWETADEYLTGNVRDKLNIAIEEAIKYPDLFNKNVESLKTIQPKELEASEISLRLGSTWIPSEYIRDFIIETLEIRVYELNYLKIEYSEKLNSWQLGTRGINRNDIKMIEIWGTRRCDAIKIIEATLNLRIVSIYDYVKDSDGKVKTIFNQKESIIAREKQENIKEEFKTWIWKDVNRREKLVKLYNEIFNNIRTREYDGSHLIFPGMSPEKNLKPHQRNAVARILYGGNTLLAHVVGAGKSATRS